MAADFGHRVSEACGFWVLVTENNESPSQQYLRRVGCRGIYFITSKGNECGGRNVLNVILRDNEGPHSPSFPAIPRIMKLLWSSDGVAHGPPKRFHAA